MNGRYNTVKHEASEYKTRASEYRVEMRGKEKTKWSHYYKRVSNEARKPLTKYGICTSQPVKLKFDHLFVLT